MKELNREWWSSQKPAFRNKLTAVRWLCHTVSQLAFTFYSVSLPIVGEDLYKAREESEMWGAAEVQEDEDTHVEVPLDQVLIEL